MYYEEISILLRRKNFIIEKEHQAISSLKSNFEFDLAFIQRLFDRLENFQFKIAYKKGTDLIRANALCRSVSMILKEGKNK